MFIIRSKNRFNVSLKAKALVDRPKFIFLQMQQVSHHACLHTISIIRLKGLQPVWSMQQLTSSNLILNNGAVDQSREIIGTGAKAGGRSYNHASFPIIRSMFSHFCLTANVLRFVSEGWRHRAPEQLFSVERVWRRRPEAVFTPRICVWECDVLSTAWASMGCSGPNSKSV